MTFSKYRLAGTGFIAALMVGGFLAGFGAGSAGAASPEAAPAAVSQAAITPHVLPHRALYRMSLDSVRNGSQIQAVEGQMVFEWRDACDGWTVEQRLNLAMTREENLEIAIKSAYTTWEDKGGTSFRFNYRNTLNGEVNEEYKGSASLDAPGKGGLATYSLPENKQIKLPSGSYFPTSHTLALLDAASAGKPIFSASVFDGTDEGGLSEINAVIGPRKPIAVEIARTGLGTTPAIAWPVRMAFFPHDKQDAAPDYEMDTTLLPNGVSEFMLMDYGEFRLRGVLEKIEVLPKPDC